MPSLTVTISDPTFTRIIAALENSRDSPEETDGQLIRRILRSVVIEWVDSHERNVAAGSVDVSGLEIDIP